MMEVPMNPSTDHSMQPTEQMATIAYPPIPTMPEGPWQYEMRREMQEIVPNLYLGPYGCATKRCFDSLTAAGIKHIVCVRQPVERHLIRPNFPESFNYLVIEMTDDYYERIIPHCRTVCEFITKHLDKGERVLVHGNGGVSRSATLLIAFIMFRYGISASEAQRFVQARRFCISPNENFLEQLNEFEPIYRANKSVMMNTGGNSKRTRDARDAEDHIDGGVSGGGGVGSNMVEDMME